MVKLLVTILALLCILMASVSAEIPQLINYQGILRDTIPPKNPVNGTFNFTFTIYDSLTGGDIVWTETQTGIEAKVGVFAVLLGSVSELLDTVFNGSSRYLGVAVDADPEMAPRTRLVSVPYAYQAFRTDTADVSYSVVAGAIQLGDIAQNGAEIGQVLKWEGTRWETADDDSGGVGWNWSDSSSHGPDSVLFADSADNADSANSAVRSRFSDSTEAITDGAIDFSDIGQNGADTGQVIKWNGTQWEAADDHAHAVGEFMRIKDPTLFAQRIEDNTEYTVKSVSVDAGNVGNYLRIMLSVYAWNGIGPPDVVTFTTKLNGYTIDEVDLGGGNGGTTRFIEAIYHGYNQWRTNGSMEGSNFPYDPALPLTVDVTAQRTAGIASFDIQVGTLMIVYDN